MTYRVSGGTLTSLTDSELSVHCWAGFHGMAAEGVNTASSSEPSQSAGDIPSSAPHLRRLHRYRQRCHPAVHIGRWLLPVLARATWSDVGHRVGGEVRLPDVGTAAVRSTVSPRGDFGGGEACSAARADDVRGRRGIFSGSAAVVEGGIRVGGQFCGRCFGAGRDHAADRLRRRASEAPIGNLVPAGKTRRSGCRDFPAIVVHPLSAACRSLRPPESGQLMDGGINRVAASAGVHPLGSVGGRGSDDGSFGRPRIRPAGLGVDQQMSHAGGLGRGWGDVPRWTWVGRAGSVLVLGDRKQSTWRDKDAVYMTPGVTIYPRVIVI